MLIRQYLEYSVQFKMFLFFIPHIFKTYNGKTWSMVYISVIIAHILQITIFHMSDLCGQLSCTASTLIFNGTIAYIDTNKIAVNESACGPEDPGSNPHLDKVRNVAIFFLGVLIQLDIITKI